MRYLFTEFESVHRQNINCSVLKTSVFILFSLYIHRTSLSSCVLDRRHPCIINSAIFPKGTALYLEDKDED